MLPKRNSNRICHRSAEYRYVVSEAPSADDGNVALTINIQSEDNGPVLRVTGLTTTRVPEMESRFYTGRQVVDSVLPQHVTALISRGIESGWLPEQSGPPVVLEVTNKEVFGAAEIRRRPTGHVR